jgi:acyl-coenzyme A thioesterase PaaI-like protein
MANKKAFQDFYPDQLSHCYGCGRLNEHGLKIKSYWDGREAVAVVEPKPYHIGIPGYVYGGLIASVIDCHCIGTASAAALRAEGRDIETSIPLRFVTASLHVDFLKPMPIGVALEVRAQVKQIKDRKVIVAATVSAKDEVCARGQVVAVQIPEQMKPIGSIA